MTCDRCYNEAVHCNIISTTGSLPVAVLFVYLINDRQYLVTHSKLGSNLDVGDAPVGDAQVCTGIMHVQTVASQQLIIKWTYVKWWIKETR